ncbi:MAG: succinylglutamate desuccinylase/aspartoacylase family protein [Deltaproteobacteria bacterium]|jgi:predicted deacylase|nr:succinylglutamate desuccinylase/aspartoacylase family protein [Deltaproteobacteria bacterium]
MKRQAPFSFGGVDVAAGDRATIDLPMARLYTHSAMTLPVHVVHGKQSGPTLFLSAAVHGDEINGVEIIRRVLHSKSMQRLKGTLLAVPVVNPYGLIQRSRYLPDRRDLNRSFPGSPKGSLAGRIAHLFMSEIVSRCTHGIDIHTGSNYRTNLPQIRTSVEDEINLKLAKAFGAPIIIDSHLRDGSLREAVADQAIPILLYEAGEALYFNEPAIRTGMRGVINVMRSIGMLPANIRSKSQDSLISFKTSWIRAAKSGVFYKRVSLGTLVRKNGLLGVVNDPLGEDREEIRTPFPGVVIGHLNLPLVHEGDALINLARVDDLGEAEDLLDEYTTTLTEEDFGLER